MNKVFLWLNIRLFVTEIFSLALVMLIPVVSEKADLKTQIKEIDILQCSDNPLIASQTIRKFDFPSIDQLPKQSGLADLFKTIEGQQIVSKSCWFEHREYLKAMLAHYQYGYMPPRPNKVQLKIGKNGCAF